MHLPGLQDRSDFNVIAQLIRQRRDRYTQPYHYHPPRRLESEPGGDETIRFRHGVLRGISKFSGRLPDIQHLTGHSALRITQGYIEVILVL